MGKGVVKINIMEMVRNSCKSNVQLKIYFPRSWKIREKCVFPFSSSIPVFVFIFKYLSNDIIFLFLQAVITVRRPLFVPIPPVSLYSHSVK